MTSPASCWASCSKRRASARLRLFCFPHAGAGARAYRDWGGALSADVEVWTVHLPGRDQRIRELPISSLPELVVAASAGLRPLLMPPFAFFGHSMGALVAFELARQRRREGLGLPACLAVSGHRAPHLADPRPPIHDLPRDQFIAELLRLEGTPPDALQDPELLDLLLPMLRADFAAVETYQFAPESALSSPIIACGGVDDHEVAPEELAAWRDHTAGEFSLRLFLGDHFYLHPRQRELTAHLAQTLSSLSF